MPRAADCPMDPAPELARIRDEQPIRRITLWDGNQPWFLTLAAKAANRLHMILIRIARYCRTGKRAAVVRAAVVRTSGVGGPC